MINETEYSRAKTKVTLYAVPFSSGDNFHFEDMAPLLAECDSIAFDGFPPMAIDVRRTIRVPMRGDYQSALPQKYNYVKLESIDFASSASSVSYYFIASMKWSGNDVLALDLELDAINTLVHGDDLSSVLDKTTMIHREHENRFSEIYENEVINNNYKFGAIVKVDKVPEGLPKPLLEKVSRTAVLDKSFKTSPAEALKECPWCIFYGRKSKDDPEFTLLLNPMADGLKASLKFGNDIATYDIANAKDYNFAYTLATKIIEYPYAPFATIQYRTSPSSGIYGFFLDGERLTPVSSTSDKDDIYNKSGLAGVKVPYSTLISKRERRRLIDNVDLPNVTRVGSWRGVGTALGVPRTIEDPKLLHSDFHAVRFAYDTYSFSVNYEMCSFLTSSPSFDVYFSASLSASATFGFYFDAKNVQMDETEDYPYYLICRRNNELPLINDAYLDYLYNGYNYDQQLKALSIGSQLTKGAIGSAVATAVNPVAGVVSGVSTLINGITSIASANVEMREKFASLATTAVGLAGNDDVDILRDATGDKLALYEYKTPDYIATMLDDLFYNYGYKRGYEGIPNVASRVWFNFVQCEPKWAVGYLAGAPKPCYERLAMRFREGITFFHHQEVPPVERKFIGGYNVARTQENWERSILDGNDD